jgi:hypothetical protein
MKIFKHVILSTALIALAAGSFTVAANAQDAQQQAKPMFKALPAHNTYNFVSPPASSSLPVFSTFYGPNKVPVTMIGHNPRRTRNNYSSSAPAFIIPIKVVIGSSTFDPNANPPSDPTHTVITNTAGSPMYVISNWTLGSHNYTNREYIDVYEKASNWAWGSGRESTYDFSLDTPVVLPTVTLTCGGSNCSTSINPITGQGTVGLVNINLMDQTIQQTINNNPTITPGSYPVFLTYDVYLTSGGCCIGGYHSAYGGIGSQTYAHTTWIDPISCNGLCQFSEDTAAFSHETGEWNMDPYVNNRGCGGLMENGDPLVQHDYVQTINGYPYHVQDLVLLPYFYQNPSKGINGWYTFRNEPLHVCSNGQ